MIYYDAELNCFLDSSVHEIPSRAKKCSESLRDNLLSGLSARKILGKDTDGNPVLIDVPQTVVPASVLLERAKAELRAMRAPMLEALTGISGRAARAGNEALAAEADALAVSLLAITDDPVLNSAEDYEAMQASGVNAYRAIAATASPALAGVFKEITGA